MFDVEKKDSIKTLLLTLWKSEDDKVTKTESGELGGAVNAYIERIRADRNIVPSFNTFYEYMRDDYRRELAEREIKVEKSDFNIDNMLTTMRQYYRDGSSMELGAHQCGSQSISTGKRCNRAYQCKL